MALAVRLGIVVFSAVVLLWLPGCRMTQRVSHAEKLITSEEARLLPDAKTAARDVRVPALVAMARLQEGAAVPLSDVERSVDIHSIRSVPFIEGTVNLHPDSLVPVTDRGWLLERARERGATLLFVYTFESSGLASVTLIDLLTLTLAPVVAHGKATCSAVLVDVERAVPIAYFRGQRRASRMKWSWKDSFEGERQAAIAAEGAALAKTVDEALAWWGEVQRVHAPASR